MQQWKHEKTFSILKLIEMFRMEIKYFANEANMEIIIIKKAFKTETNNSALWNKLQCIEKYW